MQRGVYTHTHTIFLNIISTIFYEKNWNIIRLAPAFSLSLSLCSRNKPDSWQPTQRPSLFFFFVALASTSAPPPRPIYISSCWIFLKVVRHSLFLLLYARATRGGDKRIPPKKRIKIWTIRSKNAVTWVFKLDTECKKRTVMFTTVSSAIRNTTIAVSFCGK